MLDLTSIPNSQQDIQIFQSNGNSWQTWQKPRKCNYVYIMCIGGGGGGAAGYPGVDVVYSTGGGSGGVTRALFNSQQIPERLYIQVGLGGAGGTSGVGSSGSRSWVMMQPSTTVFSQNSVLSSGASNAVGGTFGTGGNAAGEGLVGQVTANFLSLSNFLGTAGVTAIGSTTSQLPPDITALSSSIVTCGAGGGGIVSLTSTAYNGASISSTFTPTISGGTAVSSGTGGDGANGVTSFKPFYSTGGAGGGASLNGNGGRGGNGGIGSGGGAGGNSPSGFVGGIGGKGGDGLVIIISF